MKITIHNRNYNSWEITQDDVKLDIPNLIPSKYKLFDGDVFLFSHNTVVLKESIIRDNFLAGVLVLDKTYGRQGKRLLYKCIPDKKTLPYFLVPYDISPSFSKVVKNKYIVFRFIDWENEHPYGEIKETLGDVDCNKAFSEYQLWKRGIHHSLSSFTKSVRTLLKYDEPEHIQRIMEAFQPINVEETAFTIDPADCTDYDDAFSVSVENGCATINVYIANVFLWLETYNLWEHMTDRVSTIYLPDNKRTMLPPILSDNLCSLKQGTHRFAFAMTIKYNMETYEQIGEPSYKNVLVKIRKNYVYEEHKLLKNPDYKVLSKIAQTEDSHEVVAFWMIKMNTECAKYLRARGAGIFRGTNNSNSTPITNRHILEWLGNNGLSSMYSTNCIPHTQLGVDEYVHITSPIRRLVDILNQIQFQIIMKTPISEYCQKFLYKWLSKIDFINHATKEIRKTQMDCELLENVKEKTIYNGIIFDRNALNNGFYEYAVYIKELKLFSRIKIQEYFENMTETTFCIFIFTDSDTLSKKVRISKI